MCSGNNTVWLCCRWQQICQELLPEYTFQYILCWLAAGVSVKPTSAEGFERDRQLGHTTIGPHRADLRLRAEGQSVQDLLSRGQLKLLVCALRLAQGLYLRQHGSQRPCF